MGIRQDIEAEFFPDTKFAGPTEIYDRLATIVANSVVGVYVDTEDAGADLGISGEDLVAAKQAAKDFVALRLANRGAFNDFGSASSEQLEILAQTARLINTEG